jgi:hypothetical protein
MKNTEVRIGGVYWANVSGRRVKVKIDYLCTYGGWWATNLETQRNRIRIKSGQRLTEIRGGMSS